MERVARRGLLISRGQIYDFTFKWLLAGFLFFLLLFISAVLASDVFYLSWADFVEGLLDEHILFAIKLSLITSTATTLLSVIIGIPAAYTLSRFKLPGSALWDTILDLPIVLPPAVMGLTLLVFFQTAAGKWIEARGVEFVYEQKGIVLAQFVVAASFCVRALKAAFDSIDPRVEGVARTLGCSPFRAFWKITLPLARNGLIAGTIMTWARAMGEFGPILFFVGTAAHVRVMPIAIYLEYAVGNLERAVAVVVIMMGIGLITLVTFKRLGGQGYLW